MKKSNLIISIFQAIALLFVCSWIFSVEVGTVATGSMLPNIDIGESVLYWKWFPIRHIDKGDILVYQSGDVAIVHRVHEVQYGFTPDDVTRKFKMKGDNNLSTDATLVDETNYVGKVFCIISNDKINTFVKAVADMNRLTRVGIALIIFTLYLTISNVCSRKHNIINTDKEDKTPEFRSGNLVVTELTEEQKKPNI